MKPALTLFLAAFLPVTALSDTPMAGATIAVEQDEPAEAAPDPDPETGPASEWGPFSAEDATLEEFLWVARPVVVFADSENDPQFLQQMRYLTSNPDVLTERDVVVITDTDPTVLSAVRTRLRPRGFSLVLLDRNGDVMLRKPLPWSLREITHAIDKFPLRRQEMLEQRPAGR